MIHPESAMLLLLLLLIVILQEWSYTVAAINNLKDTLTVIKKTENLPA